MKIGNLLVFTLIVTWGLLAFGNNKTRQTEQVTYNGQAASEQSELDAVASSVQDEAPKMEENPSTPISSSSASASCSHAHNVSDSCEIRTR